MKTLILPSYCVLLIFLSACDSHDIARQHGLESLNTLLTLQQSQSIRDVSKYLSKFNDWRDYNEDTTSGGMWIYHKKNASTRYILTISKGGWTTSSPYSSAIKETEDSFYHLKVLFKDDSLRTRVLNQLSKDSSFRLRDTADLYGYWIRSYIRRGINIEIGNRPHGYSYVDIYKEHAYNIRMMWPIDLISTTIFEP